MLSKQELPAGTEYSTWANAREDSYRQANVRKLTIPETKPYIASPEPGVWKSESWQFAVARTVRAEGWEAEIAMIQQIHQAGSLSRFVPIRFVANNRLTTSDKTIAAFEAIVLAKALGRKTDKAKIVYGEKQAMLTVNAAVLSRSVHRKVAQVVALLSGATRPDTVINRHCPECAFNDKCRKDAVAKDDLSLLSNLTEKERARYRSKGIFTVSQLAYTFRPRRRSKRLASRPEKYHHALKALAIRERKIHVVGKLDPPMDGTPVFFDVEALPDRDFYYLIGVRVERASGTVHWSLWADSMADEKKMWEDFLSILAEVDRPKLFHYGSFEKTFMKKMCDRYGEPPGPSIAATAIASSTNLITLLYARIYFPTYSNGLKEIAHFLGFSWSDPSVSGLLSIAWRSRWEESRDAVLRDRLITYNTDDCDALCLVARTIARLQSPGVSADRTEAVPEVIHAEELGRNIQSKWRVFKSPLPDMESINAAAHWNYQRDRVFVRTGTELRPITKQHKQTNLSQRKAEKVVVAIPPLSCPKCGKSGRTKSRLLTRTVEDLVFGRDSVKRRVVQYMFQGYRCRTCSHEYGLSEWYLHARKWGWNVVAYFVYNVVGLRVPQLTMQHSLNRLFGFNLVRSTLNNLKTKAAERYSLAKRKILERIVGGDLVHADETRANIKGHLAYVWVLTNMTEVAYVLAESREAEIVHDLLKDFKGVLVSDFYAAYDSIPCPQQKCLIHLMRDLNDEILNNPFNQEMKSICMGFTGLLKSIVETVDRHGLKKRFLRKHLVDVNRFFGFLEATQFTSEAALKCKQRFEKNRETLFTFLHHDGVPWNNNNAEHAIKAFARLRDVIAGSSSRKGVDEYLTLLSVAETCEYRGIDFLDFLRSEERDVDTFACRKRRTRVHRTPAP
jgi:predicted RecB family nuclease